MIFPLLCALCFVCAALPAVMFLRNLPLYLPPATGEANTTARVDVLIPARDEAANIRAALQCVLASQDVQLEVLVYDDASTDATAEIVREYAAHDARVRLLGAGPLPAGWNGKQHACFRLAEASTAPLLLFLDADVRLSRDAISRFVAERERTGVMLLSGFPQMITVTWMEWLLLPLVHFVLLGFLPIDRMRSSTHLAYSAGCGQVFLAEREAYFACGGHAAIRETRHDGLRLPRLFREHGLGTDICDLTELASVRMYASTCGVWNGLAKNAKEGLGAPARIVPFTLALLLGQVMPLLLVLYLGASMGVHHFPASAWWWVCMLASVLLYLPRMLAAARFRQPWKSAVLHPIGVLLLLCVQWYALFRAMAGKSVAWKERTQ